MYKSFGKRALDILAAIFGLILLLPIFLVVLVLLLFANGGKPFFFQSRPGKDGKTFKIIKFKTMSDKKDDDGNFLDFDKRVTKVGTFLRKFSLDEIPQLLNVLFGDMSLIGPRPLLIEYLPLYSETQKKRHNVQPGVTGWAQVNGRNAISWEKKFELDVWYVNNMSFMIDVKIIFLTIKKVILKEGVNSQDNLNMEAFKGTKNS